MGADYEWPWQYEFPPFFTIQPIPKTKEQQLISWRNLICDYHKTNRIWEVDTTSAVFNNKKISRQLSPAAIRVVLQSLCDEGQGVMNGDRCFILWNSVSQWASLIHNWASDGGMTNTVLTLFEIHGGDDTESEPFHTMDIWLLHHVISYLEKEGKAELMLGDSEDFSDAGVKFF